MVIEKWFWSPYCWWPKMGFGRHQRNLDRWMAIDIFWLLAIKFGKEHVVCFWKAFVKLNTWWLKVIKNLKFGHQWLKITIVGDIKRVLVTKLLVTKNGVQLEFWSLDGNQKLMTKLWQPKVGNWKLMTINGDWKLAIKFFWSPILWWLNLFWITIHNGVA